jgi:hypothetical protein
MPRKKRQALSPEKSAEEQDVERLLGDRVLFDMSDPQKFGGPSTAVIYRARRAGMIGTVNSSGRTKLTRATMKKILLEGLSVVRFQYEKTGGRWANRKRGEVA